MDSYVIGKIIKKLREEKGFTQLELANIINVSDKTISKWETGKGIPDISSIELLSNTLGVSVIELMKGKNVVNKNTSKNIINSALYVCPICGNVIYSIGDNIVSCCGVTLPKLESEKENDFHKINCEDVENEYYVSINHEMTKSHYISFIAYITSDRFEIVKLYPEQNAETRFLKRGHGFIYIYCNKDGLIEKRI